MIRSAMSDRAVLYGTPPGVDFPKALRYGILARFKEQPPEALARLTVYVNTSRMQRRLAQLFDDGEALLLPRIRLLQDLGRGIAGEALPPPISGLRRRLELAQLIAQLIEAQPDLAPRASVYDLADSLAGLLDEMQGEGVTPSEIANLDVTDQSGHWQRTLSFISIVQDFLGDDVPPDAEARQRLTIEALVEQWKTSPPSDPIYIAGSTGSRGATHLLMTAVAGLENGAVILPGFDFDQPTSVWENLKDPLSSEDHPQFRYHKILRALDLPPASVEIWSDQEIPQPHRNKLISLALRPAPVTDQWMQEGRNFSGVPKATKDITLINAPSPRAEALAIALRLRKAAETGETVALITPDRGLSRQVTAALDRWRIKADDSAGMPLQLSAPGRFLRLVSNLFGQRLTVETLLTLLKHPITFSAGHDRGFHLLRTRELELHLRRYGPAFPDVKSLTEWAERRSKTDAGVIEWVHWLIGSLPFQDDDTPLPLIDHLKRHIATAETLAMGTIEGQDSELWKQAAGRKTRAVVSSLQEDSEFGGILSTRDYSDLFRSVLGKAEVRNPDEAYPNIMILGSQEARVQAADLVILGGLNDGIWPPSPTPDPWLNRKMRHDAGLLLPERRIGLSAHDFQMAAAAKEIWLSRSIRDAEAETVPSRWLNRILNLLNGLNEAGGPEALSEMTTRGDDWLAQALALEQPDGDTHPALRPSPCPPIAARPTQLSVTQIKTLIRDPYAIYARKVLGLNKLDPLRPSPDAPLRGSVLHRILEKFAKSDPPLDTAKPVLLNIAKDVLEEDVPWPTARRLWLSRLEKVADWFLETEVQRRMRGTPASFERKGRAEVLDTGFTLTAQTDRIDTTERGTLRIYDYKTGAPPSAKEQQFFDKQLPLSAALAENGAFQDIDPAPVEAAVYIGLGSKPVEVTAPLDDVSAEQAWQELAGLIRAYQSETRGYTSRRAMAKQRFDGDYDHLARFGEWEDSDDAQPEALT
ncbi:MAG: double-strand break repair protein AddB [Pseudoruegeria sp.]